MPAKPIDTVHGLMLLREDQGWSEQHLARLPNDHRVYPLADRVRTRGPAS